MPHFRLQKLAYACALAELGHSSLSLLYCDALARELRDLSDRQLDASDLPFVLRLNELALRLRMYNVYAASQSNMSEYWATDVSFLSLSLKCSCVDADSS